MLRLTGGLALATLLHASAASAQAAPAPAAMAQQGLRWFAQAGWLAPGEQIQGGENVQRLAVDEAMVWHDANTVEMLADYALATGDASYVSVLQAYRTYNPVYVFGSSTLLFGKNDFNDDKLWWALAMLRVYDVTRDPAFLQRAERVFSDVCAGWGQGSTCHASGLAWTSRSGSEKPYLNAITNELLFETAAKLAQRAPEATAVCAATPGRVTVTSPAGVDSTYPNTYLGWAAAEYRWFADYWFPAAGVPPGFDAPPSAVGHLPIPDGLGADCVPGHSRHRARWTYNQGVILGALQDLALLERSGADPDRLVPDSPDFLLGFAFQIAQAAMTSLSLRVNGRAILTEKNERGAPRSCQNPDCPQFKGIFLRYLGRLVAGTGPGDAGYAAFAPAAVSFLANNAEAIWSNRAQGGLPQSSIPYFPEKWSAPALATYYQPTQTSALDAFIAGIGQSVVAPSVVTAAARPLPSPPAQAPGCAVKLRCDGGLAVGCRSGSGSNGGAAPAPVIIYARGRDGHYAALGAATGAEALRIASANGEATQVVTCATNLAGSACDPPVSLAADGAACAAAAASPPVSAGGGRASSE